MSPVVGAVGAAVSAGVFSLLVAWMARDPYHRLRKALDIHRELPEPYKQAWVSGELHKVYLSSGAFSLWRWSLVVLAGVANVVVVLAVVVFQTKGLLSAKDSWPALVAMPMLALCTGVLVQAALSATWGETARKRLDHLARARQEASLERIRQIGLDEQKAARANRALFRRRRRHR